MLLLEGIKLQVPLDQF